jgi:type I restriction enzyme M protein
MSSKSYRLIFQGLRNNLAGRVIGVTRDSALLQEVVKCLFCHTHLKRAGDLPSEEIGKMELSKLYRSTFRKIAQRFPSSFDQDEEILLDPQSLWFTHCALSEVTLDSEDEDPVGDAYQTFVGSEIRGNEGQFFTPTAAVSWLVKAIDPRPGEKVIDPACGSGAFLGVAAAHMRALGATPTQLQQMIVGIEKDSFLAALASQHLSLSIDKEAKIYCADSLSLRDIRGKRLPSEIIGHFDVVFANPPFGSKIISADEAVRKKFELAYKWKKNKLGEYKALDILSSRTAPQVLFVERILSLLRPGGRAGLVLPESLISSPKHAYVVHYLMQSADITGVIGMPESLFKTSGKGGTHTKTCLLTLQKKEDKKNVRTHIYFAEAKWCGHDSRGNIVPKDDLPTVLEEYRAEKKEKANLFGVWVENKDVKDLVLAPRYYDPEGRAELASLGSTHDLVSLGDLIDQGVLSYSTGVEIGKLAYGTGEIPFIRTSDISGWEIKLDPKHTVSEDIYARYARKLDVQPGDILMVKDGTYLIGTCAIVTEYDRKILFQSHLYKIRVNSTKKISPEVLLAILSSEPVQRQIRSKRQTQDIIDSLGGRIRDLILPIPKSSQKRREIQRIVKKVISDRIEARELARQARIKVVDPA